MLTDVLEVCGWLCDVAGMLLSRRSIMHDTDQRSVCKWCGQDLSHMRLLLVSRGVCDVLYRSGVRGVAAHCQSRSLCHCVDQHRSIHKGRREPVPHRLSLCSYAREKCRVSYMYWTIQKYNDMQSRNAVWGILLQSLKRPTTVRVPCMSCERRSLERDPSGGRRHHI